MVSATTTNQGVVMASTTKTTSTARTTRTTTTSNSNSVSATSSVFDESSQIEGQGLGQGLEGVSWADFKQLSDGANDDGVGGHGDGDYDGGDDDVPLHYPDDASIRADDSAGGGGGGLDRQAPAPGLGLGRAPGSGLDQGLTPVSGLVRKKGNT